MNTKTFASSLLVAWPVLLIFAVLQLVRIAGWLHHGQIFLHHHEVDHVVVLDKSGTPLRYWMTILINSVTDLFLWVLVFYFAPRWWELVI